MARSRRPRRKFEWARSAGRIATVNVGAQQVQRVDLLQSARNTYGADFGRDATVTAVKGYVKPVNAQIPAGSVVGGAAGIKVADAQELSSALQATDSPAEPTQGEYYDWMWFNPWNLGPFNLATTSTGQDVATSVIGANVWAVDVRSKRTFQSLGSTLALYVGVNGTAVDTDYDYFLSIGLKLP